MKPTWDDLRLSAIDFHYHAGTERHEEYSLEDFVAYAESSGRRILGITDHWGRFLGASRKPLNHYPGSLEGFAQFAREVAQAREHHPDMILAFGPEVGFGAVVNGKADVAFELPEVDFFLGEPDVGHANPEATDRYVEAMEAMAEIRERFGRPSFIAHPLRSAVNTLVGKSGEDENGLKHPFTQQLPPLSSYADPRAHVEEILGFDLGRLAAASKKHDIPFELNDSTWGRMQAQNAEWFMERHLFFFRTLLDEGARVVLGSDQHNAASPAPTPFLIAAMLGVQPRDITFLRYWLG